MPNECIPARRWLKQLRHQPKLLPLREVVDSTLHHFPKLMECRVRYVRHQNTLGAVVFNVLHRLMLLVLCQQVEDFGQPFHTLWRGLQSGDLAGGARSIHKKSFWQNAGGVSR